MDKNILKLKGKEGDDLEKELGFTNYLETKNFEGFKKINVDHRKLVDTFLKFSDGKELNVVKLCNGIIEEFLTLSLTEIENELRLLCNNKGMFRSPDDDELAISFGFFTEEYMAEFMQEIVFFSGKEEYVTKFSSTLDEFGIKHFPPDIIPFMKRETPAIYRKLGRNEPCYCGSGIKYKKCCMNRDIKEKGKIRKVKATYY